MADIYARALAMHAEHRGKLTVMSRVPLTNRDELSLAYTPGVAAVCQAIAADKSQARELTMKRNTVAVITDGSAVLGLGNIGPEAALPVMEGKCILFKEFAGVDAFPICLATQDTEEIIAAVRAIAPGFGGINLEDIAAPRCFEIEERLKKELAIPVMHDDQHGTAAVVLAGLINALKLRSLAPADARVVINGGGAAGDAITRLLLAYGFTDITVCDRQGAVYEGRPEITAEKAALARLTNPRRLTGGLDEILAGAHIFIGVSAPGILKGAMISSMAERPIIFALANPIPEIMPEEAKEAGAFIVATGRSDYPNQINNVLIFPGVFRGVLDGNLKQISSGMLIRAAERLASLITDPAADRILPDPLNKDVAPAVAAAVQE